MRNRNCIPEKEQSILHKHDAITRHEMHQMHEMVAALEREGSSTEIIIITRVSVRVGVRIRVRRFIRCQAV
jgi:hypothetical protein